MPSARTPSTIPSQNEDDKENCPKKVIRKRSKPTPSPQTIRKKLLSQLEKQKDRLAKLQAEFDKLPVPDEGSEVAS